MRRELEGHSGKKCSPSARMMYSSRKGEENRTLVEGSSRKGRGHFPVLEKVCGRCRKLKVDPKKGVSRKGRWPYPREEEWKA